METAPKAAKSAATAFSFPPLRTGTPAPENAPEPIPGAWAGPSADPSDDLMAFEQVFYRDPAHADYHLFTDDYRRAWAAWRKAQSPAMIDDLLPEYDYAIETLLHLRCTICGGWWSVGDGVATRAYFCPWCGQSLAPAQYPEAPARPATTKEIDL